MTEVEEYPLSRVKVDDLKFDPSNPNKVTKEQANAIKKSFYQFGFCVPITVNESLQIGDGEHRALVYKELGLKEIPAFIIPRLNDDIQRRLHRQTMNKLRGEHEIKLDADEIALIFQSDKLDNLAELIATERESLENILTKHKGIQFQHEDNFDVDKALEDLIPTTKLGDIWQLGQHRIICADCTDKRSIDRLLEDKNVDMLLTDPPYGIDLDTDYDQFTRDGRKGITWDKVEGDKEPFDPAFLFEMFGYCEEMFLFGADYYIERIPDRLNGNLMVWDKTLTSNGQTGSNNVSQFEIIWSKQPHKRSIYHVEFFRFFGLSKEDSNKRLHPTMKPTVLLKQIIDNFSEENNIIIDPFLGSGSTLIACEQTNRICYGVEIDPHYVDVICKRYEAFTGKKAEKVSE